MNTAFVKGLMLAAASLIGVLTTHAASAGTADEGPRTTVVSYQDLDLSQPNDLKTLYGRIKSAAREVCDNDAGSDLGRLVIFKSCVREAVDNAMRQVQSTEPTYIRHAEVNQIAGR